MIATPSLSQFKGDFCAVKDLFYISYAVSSKHLTLTKTKLYQGSPSPPFHKLVPPPVFSGTPEHAEELKETWDSFLLFSCSSSFSPILFFAVSC